MQITIPREVEASIRERAKASGFDSVDEYVLSLFHPDDSLPSPHPLPDELWRRELEAFVQTLTPGNPDVDDSRESIYRDR